ncbi:hypothetical protein GCM10007301_46150 [Azorhizobium oxalatiphilum]|uniref:Secreted protein n=1 Tax=Azorhizobium oxalatiphilum TaxID=980631 RepID=A0A917CAJ6_9HYPH|nr:hypothetical protein [Azorhizobium oxalatiphilum]GGF80854.1 hypothetical protein GCM10007301_46150 [Azorhizobium oxalatiphilum]
MTALNLSPFRHRNASFAAVALAVLTLSAAPAAAGCTNPYGVTVKKPWPSRVANSADQKLRDAYASGTCRWIDGPHPGGMEPPCASSDTHVTVFNGSYACHVFGKKNTKDCKNLTYYPTTCL